MNQDLKKTLWAAAGKLCSAKGAWSKGDFILAVPLCSICDVGGGRLAVGKRWIIRAPVVRKTGPIGSCTA
jgi:hypothetical protein